MKGEKEIVKKRKKKTKLSNENSVEIDLPKNQTIK